jgi:hypothetical protein
MAKVNLLLAGFAFSGGYPLERISLKRITVR